MLLQSAFDHIYVLICALRILNIIILVSTDNILTMFPLPRRILPELEICKYNQDSSSFVFWSLRSFKLKTKRQ